MMAKHNRLYLLIIVVFLLQSAQIITGQNPLDQQPDNVVIVDSGASDTTLVIDTEFGTESAFGFLSTPFLPISLLMMALLIITSPVVQTAVPVVVPVVVPVIVPTPVPTTQTATQTATQTTIVPCVPTSCPEGYIISNDLTASTNCYFFSGDDEQSWSNALNICRMKGAYLWAPNTLAEANAVRSTTGFGQDVSIWIGAYSPTSDENFVFVVDGGAFTLDTLPFGESDPIDNDDCVEFEFAPNNNWNWDDDPCDRAQRYMCEFPRAVSMNNLLGMLFLENCISFINIKPNQSLPIKIKYVHDE